MTATLLLAAACAPLALALAMWPAGSVRRHACAVAPWAAVPALVLAFVPLPDQPVPLAWLLLGTWVGLDIVGRLFLAFTALLWTAAGFHARAYVHTDPHRYFFFHLLALSGNLGLIIAQDLAAFYLFFALMTFSAYGLVVHDGTPASYRAGRVYIAMAVVGETCLLIGFILAASDAASLALADIRAAAAAAPRQGLLVALFLAGFGIKAGAVPLHMWLPLAHPVAPTPASAVLSGCMIKAGLLGWIRFLPLGEGALPGWGGLLIALGLTAAFFGVAIGVTQRNPKAVLAYSSVSQMGLLNIAVGIGLSDPDAWRFASAAIPLYAMHHGLAKGALFLSVSVADHRPRAAGRRRLMRLGLVVPALALAGAPLTTGALAKLALKDAAAVAPGAWEAWLDTLLPWTAIGTTLLMARFLFVLPPAGSRERPRGVIIPWAVAVAAAGLGVWTMPALLGVPINAAATLRIYNLWTAAWPLLAGGAIVALALAASQRGVWTPRIEVPPGDALVVAERAWVRVRHRPVEDVPVAGVTGAPDPVARLAASWYGLFAESAPGDRLARWETELLRWETAAALALVILVGLWLVLS
jgi:formate hydrogenlyase subunit 3/multisubunit Na+/H+ antiporter MnhD subunit